MCRGQVNMIEEIHQRLVKSREVGHSILCVWLKPHSLCVGSAGLSSLYMLCPTSRDLTSS